MVKDKWFGYDENSRDLTNYQCAKDLKKVKKVVLA
jgi:hypothetical protein